MHLEQNEKLWRTLLKYFPTTLSKALAIWSSIPALLKIHVYILRPNRFSVHFLMIVHWVDIQYKNNPCWWSQLYRTELARQFVQR